MKQIIRRTAALVLGLALGAVSWAGLESVTHITDLNASWPLGSDLASTSDDHIRNIKTALKNDFPNINGVVNATPTQLNQVSTNNFTGLTVSSGNFLVSSGTATAPSFIPSSATVPGVGIYLPAVNTLGFATSTTKWGSINSTGNWVLVAPSSGTPLTINGTSGGSGFIAGSVSVNAAITSDFTNSSTGASASNYIRFANSADNLALGVSSNSGSFSAFFTNGPTGEQGFIGPTANFPLSIGTNNTERIRIAGGGGVTVNAPSSGAALSVNGVAGASNYAAVFTGANSSGSRGVNILGGTGASDFALIVNDAANSKNLFLISGSGVVSGYGATAAGSVDMSPDTGTFTATMTGGTTSPTCTARWTRVGNLVMLEICSATATSNATSFTYTGLPAAAQPTVTQHVPAASSAYEDNGTAQPSTVEVVLTAASGTITFWHNGASTGWTNSGVKGVLSINTVSYLLN